MLFHHRPLIVRCSHDLSPRGCHVPQILHPNLRPSGALGDLGDLDDLDDILWLSVRHLSRSSWPSIPLWRWLVHHWWRGCCCPLASSWATEDNWDATETLQWCWCDPEEMEDDLDAKAAACLKFDQTEMQLHSESNPEEPEEVYQFIIVFTCFLPFCQFCPILANFQFNLSNSDHSVQF